MLPALGHAETHQSLSAIRDAVVKFVTAEHVDDAKLQVQPDSIDARLRLADCSTALHAFWAAGSKTVGNTTVGVRCNHVKAWKLYIPTRVRLMQPVVVANRALSKGQRLEAQDLRIEHRDVGGLRRPAVRDPAQVLGYRVHRPIPPGRVVHAAMLRAPVLVERGRRVRLAVRTQGMDISMSGQAMEDGALGDTVKVRNTSSRAIVEGVVTGAGTVRTYLRGSAVKTSLNQ
ncbi:MAG: flagella basal body P-ring formation protein FlgA [Gammaproteobacteria bacterium]|jgi:flagella basal body P-ring formation protein FlgA